MKIFNLDSPLMVFLGRVADLMIINILTLLCCIPIITIGPAFTAAHYVSLKMVRNEDCYIVRSYFKSFKENFKQATIIWLLILVAILVMVGDFYIITKSGLEFSNVMKIVIIVVGVIVLMTTVYVFPVLARFENTIIATLKNAFLMSVLQLLKTALMLVLYVAPFILAIFVYQAVPVVMLLGISVPIYVSAMLYNGFFQKIEGRVLEAQEETAEPEEDDPDRIFSDKLDEALIEQNMEK
jgi:uncharacterized membrane protein YesL